MRGTPMTLPGGPLRSCTPCPSSGSGARPSGSVDRARGAEDRLGVLHVESDGGAFRARPPPAPEGLEPRRALAVLALVAPALRYTGDGSIARNVDGAEVR